MSDVGRSVAILTIELARVDLAITEIEQHIESVMRPLERKKSLDYSETSDYGQTSFLLNIIFDEFNVEEMEAIITRAKAMFVRRRELRAEQGKLRRESASLTAYRKNIASDIATGIAGRLP